MRGIPVALISVRERTNALQRAAGHVGAMGWHALRLYRLARRLWEADHHALALLVTATDRVVTGVEIPPTADFGPGLVIMHGRASSCIPRRAPAEIASSTKA